MKKSNRKAKPQNTHLGLSLQTSRNPACPIDFAIMEPRCMLAGVPQFIDMTSDNTSFSGVTETVQVNNQVFFAARGNGIGVELFATDGKKSGTNLIKDIFPGSSSSNLSKLTNVNGTLYFVANNGQHGYELWKSNGTSLGTVLVKDINPGAGNSDIDSLTNVNGILFFVATDSATGLELWRSDGSDIGTTLVKDIRANKKNSSPRDLTNVNGALFFAANNGFNGHELWRSDGTFAGTTMVLDINPGSASSIANASFVNVNGTLFFDARTVEYGVELWKSNGDASTTLLVSDIVGDSAYPSSYPSNLTNVNGVLFFNGLDANSNIDGLWKTDGTDSGTIHVSSAAGEQLQGFTNVNGSLFFRSEEGDVWMSNGTLAGTKLVSPIDYVVSSTKDHLNHMGTFYYVGDAGLADGEQLWETNGTLGGLKKVTNILGADGPTKLGNLLSVNGRLFFTAVKYQSGNNPTSLWVFDGGEEPVVAGPGVTGRTVGSPPYNIFSVNNPVFSPGQSIAIETGVAGVGVDPATPPGDTNLIDIISGASGSSPSNITNVNGTIYFVAGNSVRELWKSDGTPGGTVRVDTGDLTINKPGNLTNVNGRLYFTADFSEPRTSNQFGLELGTISPTSGRAILISDIRAGSAGSSPQQLTNLNGKLFFTADDGTAGRELWKSNGSLSSTNLVRDINPGSASSDPASLTNVSGTLYFSANNGTHGRELWLSTGYNFLFPTKMVKDIAAGTNGSNPELLTNINGKLYFAASDATHGMELRKLEPNESITTMDVYPGVTGSNPLQLTNVKGNLYFSATGEGIGTELWSVQAAGSTASLVKNIRPGSGSSNPALLRNMNGTLMFAADDGSNGQELWRSNGASNGTVLVKDIRPGNSGSYPTGLAVMSGRLYFAANDGVSGVELWSSHYSSTSVKLVVDLVPGSQGSSPLHPTTFGPSFLAFSASTNSTGRELYVLGNSELSQNSPLTPNALVASPVQSEFHRQVPPQLPLSENNVRKRESSGPEFYFRPNAKCIEPTRWFNEFASGAPASPIEFVNLDSHVHYESDSELLDNGGIESESLLRAILAGDEISKFASMPDDLTELLPMN